LNNTSLDNQTKKPDDYKGYWDCDERVTAKLSHNRSRVGTNHDQFAVRHVYHPSDTEDDRQA
jgi:hypothetical protein